MAKKFIIGIDLGGTNLKVALVDLNYGIKYKRVLSTKSFKKRIELISAIVLSIQNLLKVNRLKNKDILGIGIGLPGPVDIEKGMVHFFPNIPGWKNVNLRSLLKTRIKLPLFLDNDANLMCLAEHRQGAAVGFKNVVCLTLGTGVGGGIIIENKLYRGSVFAAGELGHIPINESGRRCNCGGIACLETYIGNQRIKAEARKIFKRDISLEELSVLAKKGNSSARYIWTLVAGHLAVALCGMVNIFNPDAIVIGGGVANSGKILFYTATEIVKNQAMPVQARHVKIRKAKLGNDAGLIGAAILVRESLR